MLANTCPSFPSALCILHVLALNLSATCIALPCMHTCVLAPMHTQEACSLMLEFQAFINLTPDAQVRRGLPVRKLLLI